MNNSKEPDNFTVTTPKQLVHLETKITMSIERLRLLLSEIYEIAIDDVSKVRLYKYYNVFLSIGFTLLLTLFTAQFNNVLSMNGETIRSCLFLLCMACLLIGSILALINVSVKHKNVVEERNIAVDKALKDIKSESAAKL